mmetsp:Transcript_115963/g.361225  ORF Transcript_115963/g.361225 Transcript_115963/m.361225 type:complete len:207 (+) Transcript_115963:179-799(+)
MTPPGPPPPLRARQSAHMSATPSRSLSSSSPSSRSSRGRGRRGVVAKWQVSALARTRAWGMAAMHPASGSASTRVASPCEAASSWSCSRSTVRGASLAALASTVRAHGVRLSARPTRRLATTCPPGGCSRPGMDSASTAARCTAALVGPGILARSSASSGCLPASSGARGGGAFQIRPGATLHGCARCAEAVRPALRGVAPDKSMR